MRLRLPLILAALCAILAGPVWLADAAGCFGSRRIVCLSSNNGCAPTVTTVSPFFGSTAGSNIIFITGKGFSNFSAVNFGGTPGTSCSGSATLLTCTTPAGSAGITNVTVTTPGGTSPTGSANRFNYMCPAAATYVGRSTEGFTTASYLATMICGMVANGVGCSAWSGSTGNMDILHIHAQDNQADVELNLCSTSFGLTPNGSITFTAKSNSQSDGTTGYYSTGFTPSTAGGNFTVNSASVGTYTLATAATSSTLIGCSQAAVTNTFLVPTTSGAGFFGVNASLASQPVAAGVTGLWIGSKTSGSLQSFYRNGNTTPIATSNPTTDTNCSNQMLILARNANGTPSIGVAAPLAADFAGGALTSTQQAAISTWLNGFMTSQGGINVY